jgi:hypothetical protein
LRSSRVRFGVMCSRPPCCVESIAARRELRARPAMSRTTGPTCRGSVTPALPCRTYTPRHPWSDASLEVSCPLQRSLAALALSGAAGLRTIPLRRFIDPPARARRAYWARRTCPASDVCSSPLRFSALERIRCDEAHVADVFWVRAFQSNPSLARRVGPNGPRVRPCRRVDDLLLCH